MQKQKLKYAQRLADRIYNISSVLKDYSQKHKYIEEIRHQSPIIEYLHDNTDKLNCLFINREI